MSGAFAAAGSGCFGELGPSASGKVGGSIAVVLKPFNLRIDSQRECESGGKYKWPQNSVDDHEPLHVPHAVCNTTWFSEIWRRMAIRDDWISTTEESALRSPQRTKDADDGLGRLEPEASCTSDKRSGRTAAGLNPFQPTAFWAGKRSANR